MIFNFTKTSKVYNLFKILLFSWFYITGFCAASDESSAGKATATALLHMPFKIGFEFQEIGGLCPWALNDITVQRKPLFCMPAEGRVNPLWHVVIDTNDLEFVTSPYSAEEGPILQRCLETLFNAFQLLKANLEARETIIFDEWVAGITGIIPLPEYELVRNKHIIKPPKWAVRFAPQVTIQHPLEWTIPLYYGIFDLDCSDMVSFSASFPYRDSVLKAFKERESEKLHGIFADAGKKINGLVFLHALTLVQMSPVDESDGREALEETLESLDTCCQVDAKMKLTLMSRRPFSAMHKDISASLTVPYEDYFRESIMGFNKQFVTFAEVEKLFCFSNYGDQFFDPDTKSVRSLEALAGLPPFTGEFFSSNDDLIRRLLSQGVITTAMIRNSVGGMAIFEPYFNAALNISLPTRPRYDLDISDAGDTLVVAHESTDDVLSPPWFLGEMDSMGRFKGDISAEDKKYGEAIIEIRAIKSVGTWFLKKVSLEGSSKSGKFLTDPDILTIEGMSLFNFLSSFTQKHFSDIYMGILYALQKY